jgi:hypothetical protein
MWTRWHVKLPVALRLKLQFVSADMHCIRSADAVLLYCISAAAALYTYQKRRQCIRGAAPIPSPRRSLMASMEALNTPGVYLNACN